jgi:Domain of unknown function (DUF1906)
VLAADIANQLFGAGFRYAIRYLSRGFGQQSGDLSTDEVQTILAAGLALMAVQHCPRSGWAPAQALGDTYGQNAALNATAMGLPIGMSLWLDLEGVASYSTAEDTIAYCNAWAGEVEGHGYLPGLYVGANQPLSGDDLYWRLRVTRYWRSASTVPDIPYRGYCMVQALAPSPVDGIDLDRDVVMADAFGGVPMWLAPTPGVPMASIPGVFAPLLSAQINTPIKG